MSTHTITISGGEQSHQLAVAPQQTVLDAAIAANIPIAYSCRTGDCGSCVATVTQSDDGTAPGMKKLLCQLHPLGNMHLLCTLVDGLAGQQRKKVSVRVSQLTRLAPDVMALNLQPPPGQGFDALPGQYLDVMLRGGLRRSYSMAKATQAGGDIELHLRHVADGTFTTQVFEQMKPGDVLRIEGPFGSFFHRANSERGMLLLATGTGFAPIQAIIEAELAQGGSRPIWLYWGGRTESDLYLDRLCKQWAASHARLQYRPVLDHAPDSWTGRRGYIQQAVLHDLAACEHDLRDWEAYACGSGAMVASARALLVEEGGLDKAHFHSDAFNPVA